MRILEVDGKWWRVTLYVYILSFDRSIDLFHTSFPFLTPLALSIIRLR